jgi:ABC-type methionine transport system ATPase subunit
VGAVVAEPMRTLRPDIAPNVREDAVQALLVQVGLDPRLADRRAGSLSGGQAQRVAIARALAAKPELLLLDEATSALDPLIAADILALLKELQASHALTLVMITHDLASASMLCQHLLVLDAGRVVEAGPMAQVIAAPQHAVTKALIAATQG